MDELFQLIKNLDLNNLEETKILLRTEDFVLAINNEPMTFVPYPSVDRMDGNYNYGYKWIKGDLNLLNEIPELNSNKVYFEFIKNINTTIDLETIGCEKSIFDNEDELVKYQHGSYTHIILSDYELNKNPINFYPTLKKIIDSVKDCHKSWANVEIEVERLKGLFDIDDPVYSILLRVIGYGRTEDEAIKLWENTIKTIKF